MAQITNIFGPPGTGKTTECIRTAGEWIEDGVAPEAIGYFSFTRNAAREAQERAAGKEMGELPWWRTLHSAAYRLIGQDKDRVCDKWKQQEFGKVIGIPFNPYLTEDELYEQGASPGNLCMQVWDYGRNRLYTSMDEAWADAPVFLTERLDRRLFVKFVGGYEAWKREKKYRDFTDMLLIALDQGEPPYCSHVVIDEAQDLTPLQWKMAHLCESGADVVLRAGDDDQALFSFSGARAEDYTKQEGVQRVLAQSYRVPQKPYEAAQKVIRRNNPHRVEKDYHPRDAEGSFERRRRADPPPPPESGTSLYVFRNKKHLNAHAERLMAQGVLFDSNRFKTPLNDKEAGAGLRAAVKFHLHGRITAQEHADLIRTVRYGPMKGELADRARGVWRESMSRPFEEVDNPALTPEGMRDLRRDPFCVVTLKGAKAKYVRTMVGRYGLEAFGKKSNLFLSTVHGSKGMEFDHVFISTDAVKCCQDGMTDNPQEENRLRYVAITRAKENVTVLAAQDKGGWEI